MLIMVHLGAFISKPEFFNEKYTPMMSNFIIKHFFKKTKIRSSICKLEIKTNPWETVFYKVACKFMVIYHAVMKSLILSA